MKTINRCIICGTEHNENFCPTCGARADIGLKEERHCPKCGTQCADTTCPVCGTATVTGPAQHMKKCLRCGRTYDTPFCPYCGYQNTTEDREEIEHVDGEVIDERYAYRDKRTGNTYYTQTQVTYYDNTSRAVGNVRPKNKMTAMLLCVFGGVIGLHRFYTGKIGTGLLYLFTGGFGGLGILIDFLSMLGDNYRDANGNLLT